MRTWRAAILAINLILFISLHAFAGSQFSRTKSQSSVSVCAILLAPQDQIIATLRELYNDHVLSAHDLARIRNGENPLRAHGGINAHTFSGVIDAVIGQLKQNPEADTKLEELIRELEIERGDQRIQVVETK